MGDIQVKPSGGVPPSRTGSPSPEGGAIIDLVTRTRSRPYGRPWRAGVGPYPQGSGDPGVDTPGRPPGCRLLPACSGTDRCRFEKYCRRGEP